MVAGTLATWRWRLSGATDGRRVGRTGVRGRRNRGKAGTCSADVAGQLRPCRGLLLVDLVALADCPSCPTLAPLRAKCQACASRDE
jgi:hypothetical protein